MQSCTFQLHRDDCENDIDVFPHNLFFPFAFNRFSFSPADVRINDISQLLRKTSRVRPKSALYLRPKKCKILKYANDVFYEKLTKKFHPKEAFRAGKTLQKFGYSGWDKCEHLFSNLRLLLSKTEYTSERTSKIRI